MDIRNTYDYKTVYYYIVRSKLVCELKLFFLQKIKLSLNFARSITHVILETILILILYCLNLCQSSEFKEFSFFLYYFHNY